MKNECEIVKDLLPNYIEDLVSKETREYIDKHIKNCSKCKELLENMRESSTLEEKQNVKEEEVEIRHIKKYKRRIKIFKISIISLVLIVILLLSLFFCTYLPKYLILSKTYNRIKEISNKDNYKISTSEYYVDGGKKYKYTTTYFYKDGKYKEEQNYSNLSEYEKIYYGDINTDIDVFIDKKTNDISQEYSQIKGKEEIMDMFCEIEHDSQDITSLIGVKVCDNNYNGKDCYVLRYGNNITSYREVWIEKETMLPIREVQNISNGCSFERSFLIQENVVTDEDVTFNNKKD